MVKEEGLKERKSSDIFSLQLVLYLELFLEILQKIFTGSCEPNVKRQITLAQILSC